MEIPIIDLKLNSIFQSGPRFFCWRRKDTIQLIPTITKHILLQYNSSWLSILILQFQILLIVPQNNVSLFHKNILYPVILEIIPIQSGIIKIIAKRRINRGHRFHTKNLPSLSTSEFIYHVHRLEHSTAIVQLPLRQLCTNKPRPPSSIYTSICACVRPGNKKTVSVFVGRRQTRAEGQTIFIFIWH